MSGFSALAGGGGLNLSASSSAKSGDARTGDVGISVGGIQTGGSGSNTVPSWVWIAAIALAALFILRR